MSMEHMGMGMGDWGMKKEMDMGMGMGMMPGMCSPVMGMMGKGMHWRHFMSNDEKISKLEDYLKQLQMEEKGVMEAIAKMKMMK